ncbi:MAG: hypothetical protein ACLU4J_25620 [Butyricimonas paravirosa]
MEMLTPGVPRISWPYFMPPVSARRLGESLCLVFDGAKEGAGGLKVVNDYYASLTETQRLEPQNSFLFTRYTLDLSDEKSGFMVDHRDEFDVSVRELIHEKVEKLYHSELGRYFSGYIFREGAYKEENYQALKRKIQELGLVEKNKYEPMFRLIEGRVKEGDAAFLKLCRENMGALSDVGRNLLIMNITRLVQTEDQEILQQMAEFVRANLSILPPAIISFAGRMLRTRRIKSRKTTWL